MSSGLPPKADSQSVMNRVRRAWLCPTGTPTPGEQDAGDEAQQDDDRHRPRIGLNCSSFIQSPAEARVAPFAACQEGLRKRIDPREGGQGDSADRLVQDARLGALAGLALALDLPAIAFEIRSSSKPSPANLMTAWMVSASLSRDLTAMHGLPGRNSSGVPPQ
jgi:hypothetical protein